MEKKETTSTMADDTQSLIDASFARCLSKNFEKKNDLEKARPTNIKKVNEVIKRQCNNGNSRAVICILYDFDWFYKMFIAHGYDVTVDPTNVKKMIISWFDNKPEDLESKSYSDDGKDEDQNKKK